MANGTCTLSMLCFCKLGSSGSLLGPYIFYKIGSIKGGFGTSLRDSNCVNNTIEIHALAHFYHRHVGRLCLCSRNKRVRFCVFFSKKDCIWRFSNVWLHNACYLKLTFSTTGMYHRSRYLRYACSVDLLANTWQLRYVCNLHHDLLYRCIWLSIHCLCLPK